MQNPALRPQRAAVEQAPAYPWHMPSDWWLKNKRYFAYMLRELTAVFAALWVLLFLVQIPMMSAGAQNLPVYNFAIEPETLEGCVRLFETPSDADGAAVIVVQET